MVNKTGVNRNTKRQPHWNGKNPAQIPDAAPRSRVALDPVAYDNLIKQHGVRVKVYRSMFCPNVKSVDGGEHNIDCTLCNGSGYLDVDPIESVAYLANQNFQEEMTVEGYHDGNSVGGTFLGGVELQYFTRVDLMDFTQPFYERVLQKPVTILQEPEQASFSITFDGNFPNDVTHYLTVENILGENKFFEQITGNALNFNFFGVFAGSAGNNSVYEIVNRDGVISLGIQIEPLGSERSAAAYASLVANGINNMSTDKNNPTSFFNLSGTVGATAIRLCTAVQNEGTVTITKTVTGIVPNIQERGDGPGSFFTPISEGSDLISEVVDHLKYDCRRANVIIDKDLNQYHQDIDFKLTPQGNVSWIIPNDALEPTRSPGTGKIYSVHYESVIQYRAISAMHINRFAQVPDKSTGLVAQVKMPEQWMLQKEFLIIRRDEYGDEIKKTGIFGEIVANQPFNPAPADTL